MIELLTPAQMAEADRLTIANGIPGLELMEKAGAAVAAEAIRATAGSRIAVVAGPGNNGGDGFVAARLLAEQGRNVRVILVGERDKLKGDAAAAAQRWAGGIEPPGAKAFEDCDLIIDALFGAGLDRAVQGPARATIEAMNASKVPIIAVDLPSGVSGATGAVMGAAVVARETVTFFRRKPGHLLLPGRLHCGVVSVVDIGIPAKTLARIKPLVSANEPALWASNFPWPRIDGHKYDRGHAVVVSGGISFTGAARLAARGALRAGAGLVTIASPRDALLVHAIANAAVMVRAVDGGDEFRLFLAGDLRRNAVLLGPGGGVGQVMRELVGVALTCERAAVLDADALTSFADEPQPLFAAIAAAKAKPTVLTPHEGEFDRLFKTAPQVVDAKSKLEKAITAAKASQGFIVLKGPDTIVAAPDGRAAISANAPPWLATAGTGDVLAGMIVGLLAQGMPAFDATAAAAWLHGEAANQIGPGLISEDLPDALPAVLRRLYSEWGAAPAC